MIRNTDYIHQKITEDKGGSLKQGIHIQKSISDEGKQMFRIRGKMGKGRSSSKEDIQMANRYRKRCSASLIIGKMKIKTIVKYHVTPERLVVIKKIRDNKCWWGCGKRGTLMHCWCECKMLQLLWENMAVVKKLKIELP